MVSAAREWTLDGRPCAVHWFERKAEMSAQRDHRAPRRRAHCGRCFVLGGPRKMLIMRLMFSTGMPFREHRMLALSSVHGSVDNRNPGAQETHEYSTAVRGWQMPGAHLYLYLFFAACRNFYPRPSHILCS